MHIALKDKAEEAADFLRAMNHEGCLLLLCHLSTGEKSVGELQRLLDIRQAAASQMLARLRRQDLISDRRDGKEVYYSISDERVLRTVRELHDMFCADEN